MPLQEAAQIILYILEGLEYLADAEVYANDRDRNYIRKRGVVHRDIKPANIFFEEKDNIESLKIGNLGTAKTYLSGNTIATDHVRSDYYAWKSSNLILPIKKLNSQIPEEICVIIDDIMKEDRELNDTTFQKVSPSSDA